MNFVLTYQDQEFVCQNIKDLEDKVISVIRSWNNFGDTSVLFKIELKKTVNPDIDTLGVTISEEIKLADLFGRS